MLLLLCVVLGYMCSVFIVMVMKWKNVGRFLWFFVWMLFVVWFVGVYMVSVLVLNVVMVCVMCVC